MDLGRSVESESCSLFLLSFPFSFWRCDFLPHRLSVAFIPHVDFVMIIAIPIFFHFLARFLLLLPRSQLFSFSIALNWAARAERS